MTLRAPFPWFGGKSRVSPIVWERFGDVPNYVEPFAGSLAVLLARPHPAGIETVNDRDAYLCNFWRALQADPAGVAAVADWPVNETDLHARHRWLVESAAERVDRLLEDPSYYDVQVAGWWVWGLCAWIGSGWCRRPDWNGRIAAGRCPRGVHALAQERPHTAHGGKGVHRGGRRPALGSQGGGNGVHRPSLHGQIPDLSGDAGAAGRGIHASAFEESKGTLADYLVQLAERLRRVRVCCGDWSRVMGPAVTTCIGTTGVFLDPPYAHSERDPDVYNHDTDISADVRRWAIEHGDDPGLRIALCGYAGEHEMPASWTCVAWRAHGGYGLSARGKRNARRERIWFSPACLTASQGVLL